MLYLMTNCSLNCMHMEFVAHCSLGLLCPVPNRWGIKRCFCLTSDVCLSRTSSVTREQRPKKTKIGTEIAHVTSHVTRTSLSRSKVKGQGHQAALLSAALTRKAAAAVSVEKYCYIASAWRRARRYGAHGGGKGWGHIVSPRAQLVNLFSGRTFTTKINDLLSAVASLLSGVVQGSVVGPLIILTH